MRFFDIDLHSDNSLVVIIDEEGQVAYGPIDLLNRLIEIFDALVPTLSR